MKPSIWSSFLIDLSPEEAVANFSKKGWRQLELSTEHGLALLDRGDPSRIGREFLSYSAGEGVSFPQGHLWLQSDIACTKQEETFEVLKRNIDLFLELGIGAAVLHPGGGEMRRNGRSKDEIFEMRVKALKMLTDYIKGTRMFICLENVGDAPDIDGLLLLLDAVGTANLGICLDTGHLNLAEERGQRRFITKAGAHLRALHITDNDGSGDQHLIPYGKGRINWTEVVSALKETGYSGLFNFEIPGENSCPMDIRMAKLDYLKRVAEIMLS